MPHNSTLGYSKNPVIGTYQASFLVKLQNLWKQYVSLVIPPANFLLFPDIHGPLLVWARHGNLDRQTIFATLKREYALYVSHGNTFLLNEEEAIPGTDILLTLDFQNLDVEKNNHPDHQKNHVGITFGSKQPEEWRELFAKSFDILAKVSPGFMDEINTVIRKIIPFDVSAWVHNSGSYSDHIGHLLMSFPTGMDHPELALLEAILHEYNHNKLNLILQTEAIVLNDSREIYYSPYRPDARHIHGIYLGIHAIAWAYWVIWNAHVSWVISLPENWQEKAVLYILKNWLSLQVLDKYAQLSPLGKDILEEMRVVHQECLLFIKQANLHPGIMERAKGSLIAHFQDVKKNYPRLMS